MAEVKKKLEAIEERFVIGEIDRNLYDKFRPKYDKECFELEQELNKSDGYFSNLIYCFLKELSIIENSIHIEPPG